MSIEIKTPNNSGDITSVGDITSGAAFDGTQGTTLEFISTSTPLTPSAGQMKLYTVTTQGHTRPVCLDEDGIEHTLIRDNLRLVRNTSGSTITKGQAVYITGSTGNIPNVSLARANSLSTLPAVGLTIESTTNNGYGEVIILGEINSTDTSAFSSGDRLFVSATTAGALTTTRPAYPNFAQRIGSVSVSGVGNGSIAVSIAPFIGGEENWTTANNYTVAGTLTALSLLSSTSLTIGNSLIIPSNTNPSLTTSGQVSIDTSTGPNAQIRFYGNEEYALSTQQSKSFVIISPTTASDYPIWRVPYAITLKKYTVQCNGGNNIIGALDIANSLGVSPTAVSSDVTSWSGSSTSATISNSIIPVDSYTNWHTTSISGTPLSVTVSFDYTINTNIA